MANYKVVDAGKLDADLQTVADAIKAKAGTEEAMEFPSGFASAVESIETGGGADHTQEDGLITGTLTEYTNDRVESVRGYAFANVNAEIINLPNVKTTADNAFTVCPVKDLNFPEAVTLGAVGTAPNILTINAPKATTIAKKFCRAKKTLTSVNLPNITHLPEGAFYGCSALTSFNFQSVRTIEHVGTVLAGVPMEAFDFPSLEQIPIDGFGSNTTVNKLILRRTSAICALGATFSFLVNFEINGKGGTVYVPRALIESYQTATNWSTLYAAGTCTFLALEDYTVDGTTTGEIDWDKINGGTSV